VKTGPMVVFDIVLNGEVKETIKPMNQRLKDIYAYMAEQKKRIKAKYGKQAVISRRMIY
jgi:hypothetical protein